MRLYWEIARRGYGRYAAYPAATLAGIWTNTVFGFLQAYILLALYENRDDIGGYDPSDAVTYVWLAQAMLMTVNAFGWFEVALRIRSGDIATDLARPLDPLRYWLSFDLGRALYHFAFRGIPPFVLGMVVFDVRLPESPATWLWFGASITLAVVVSFALPVPLQPRGLLAARLPRRRRDRDHGRAALLRLHRAAAVLPGLVGGGRARAAVRGDRADPGRRLPRAGDGAEIAGALLLQALWAVILLGLARLVLGVAIRRVVIQGG